MNPRISLFAVAPLLAAVAAVVFAFGALVSTPAYAADDCGGEKCFTDRDCATHPACLAGLKPAAKEAGLQTDDAKADLSFAIGRLIGYILALVGVVFLILTVYGGILWMTAAGNEEQVGNARGIIVNASIGLLVTMAAYTITYFVTSTVLTTVGVTP